MTETTTVMPGSLCQTLLEEIAEWQAVTTIIIHGGSIFEFKGPFPKGAVAHGFYNLDGGNGFEGHLNIEQIAQISFQDKPHRGRDSYAFVFENKQQETVFKIFLGRDEAGEVFANQLARFKSLQQQYA